LNIKTRNLNLILNIFLLVIFTLFYIGFYFYFDNYRFNIVGFFIFVFSSFIVIFSIISILENGVNSYNIFFFIFYIFMMLNTFNVSDLQSMKNLVDMYFYFVGPIFFGICLYLGEKLFYHYFSNKNINIINPNIFAFFLLFMYIFSWIYVYSITGIRLFDNQALTIYSSKYIIPGISGVTKLIFWLLLIYFPHVNKHFKLSILVSTLLLQGVLYLKRGEIVRVLLFMFIYFLVKNGKKVFSKKNFMYIIIFAISIIIVFTLVGEYRQSLRMGDSEIKFNINNFLQSNINNKYINWIYGYTALNYDVLSGILKDKPQLYKMQSIFLPMFRIFKGNNWVEKYYSENNSFNLRGFNASTFLSNYIIDLGYFYIIELLLLGLFVAFFIAYSKKHNYTGLYSYLVLLISLTFFGDYFTIPINFYAIIFSAFLLRFTNINKRS